MDRIKEDIIDYVKTYTKDLFGYAMTKVRQKETAEDLVQETFLAASGSLASYEGKSNVKTWLFSILKHKIADYYRYKYKKANEVSFGIIDNFFDENQNWKPEHRPISWTNDKELLDDPEFSKTFENCIAGLPEKWSSAVRLKYLEENDTKIICVELEITTSNFWQIMHRAKLHLRNCLELKWFKKIITPIVRKDY